MTRDEAVRIVLARLAYLRGEEAGVIDEMALAQENLENGVIGPHGGVFHPWFLLVRGTFGPTTEEEIGLPASFLRDYEADPLWVIEGDVRWKLKRETREKFVAGTGAPRRFEIVAKRLYINPKPERQINLEFMFYARDRSLRTNTTNKWLENAPGLIIAETIRMMATRLQMAGVLAFAERSLAEEQRRIWSATFDRLEQDREIIIGRGG